MLLFQVEARRSHNGKAYNTTSPSSPGPKIVFGLQDWVQYYLLTHLSCQGLQMTH